MYAYKVASDGYYNDSGEWIQDHEAQISDALRAAVNAVTPEKTIEDINYVHQNYVEGYMDALYEILIIANELEAK